MSIDPRLLNKNTLKKEEEKGAGQEIRRGKVSSKKAKQEKKSEEKSEEGQKKSLRQRLSSKKGSGKKDKKKKKEEQENNALAYPTRKGSKLFLRWSWTSLFVTGCLNIIPSLGYLNFHLFFRRILPSFFVKFGEEWKPSGYKGEDTLSKSGMRSLGFMEILALFFLDFLALGCLIVVIAIMGSIVFVIYKYFGWLVELFI